MNDNDVKKLYTAAQVPEVDLENRILNELYNNSKKRLNFTFRTAVASFFIMAFTVVIALAAVGIITNSDGSHTLINEDGKEYTISAKSINWNENEPCYKLVKAMSSLEYDGDQAKVGLYQPNEDAEVEFWVKPAYDTYWINDDNISDVTANKNTPDYFIDLVEKLESDFSLFKVVYAYYIKPELRDEIKMNAYNESTIGEIYTNVITVDKSFGVLDMAFVTKLPDKYMNTSILISHESLGITGHYPEVDFEVIEINQREGFLSKRSNGSYIVQTEINGYGVTVISDINDVTENIIELTSKVLDVLEDYTLNQ